VVVLPLLVAIAVLWNPVLPFDFSGRWWQGAQFVAALLFLLVGALVKVRVAEDRNTRGASARR